MTTARAMTKISAILFRPIVTLTPRKRELLLNSPIEWYRTRQLRWLEVLHEQQFTVATKRPFLCTQQLDCCAGSYSTDSSSYTLATLYHNYQESDIVSMAASGRATRQIPLRRRR